MKTKTPFLPALVLSLGACAAHSQAAGVFAATRNSQDSIVGERQTTGTAAALGYYVGGNDGQVGVGGANPNREHRNLILGFTLPIIDGPISLVTFSITVTSASASGGAINIDLYGLATTNPDGSGVSLFFEGDTDATETKLADTFTDTSAVAASVKSQAVTAFIQSLYTGNTPNQAEVFFRLNSDTDISPGANPRRVTFTNNSATLNITTVPEPSAALLAALGCLALLRRKRA